MKRRKILTALLSSALALTMLAGCQKPDANAGSGSSGTSSQGQSSGQESSQPVSSGANKVESGKLKEIHQAIKDTYGESYIPSMEIDAQMLEEQFGIKQDLIKEVVAEGPMMSTHVDMFIGIEAADSEKADTIEETLKKYYKTISEDTLQYPMNIAKVQAARIERIGDYVFFLLLGETSNEAMDMNEEDQLKYYQSENQKAVDAIHRIFGE